MLITVTGASGSGKSEFAEDLLLRLDGDGPGNRIYVATMEPFGGSGGTGTFGEARALRRWNAAGI